MRFILGSLLTALKVLRTGVISLPLLLSEKMTSHFTSFLGTSLTSTLYFENGKAAFMRKSFLGSTQSPRTGRISNLTTRRAANTRISILTKCRPGHGTTPPPLLAGLRKRRWSNQPAVGLQVGSSLCAAQVGMVTMLSFFKRYLSTSVSSWTSRAEILVPWKRSTSCHVDTRIGQIVRCTLVRSMVQTPSGLVCTGCAGLALAVAEDDRIGPYLARAPRKHPVLCCWRWR